MSDASPRPFVTAAAWNGAALVRAWRDLWTEEALFLVLVAAYVASGYLADALGVAPGMMRASWRTPTDAVIPVVVGWVVLGEWIRRRLRVRNGDGSRLAGAEAWKRAWLELRSEILTPARIVRVGVIYVAVRLLLDTYTRWKGAIPTVHPFAWDQTLSDWDVRLHLGRAPWQWLQPVLGHSAITRAMDGLYWMWVPTVMLVVLWLAWGERAEIRARFLLTFALAWIVLGTVAATVFSSGGPCYFEPITGSAGEYERLLAYLRDLHARSPLGAIAGQGWLWDLYAARETRLYAGISAMPSMHVAMPFLYTLAAGRVHRAAAAVCGTFTLLILVASVHLGWHYAIDGYASIVGVWLLWEGSGRLLRRRATRP